MTPLLAPSAAVALIAGAWIFGAARAESALAKQPAAGIIYLSDDQDGPLQQQPTHFQNAACDGLMFRTTWKDMEPAEGAYDWGKVDAMLDAAHSAHKILGLGVAAGFRSPNWLTASGAEMTTGTLIRSFAAPRTISMAWPWDPVYLKKWGSFVTAMGRRYDQDSALAYVQMAGMGTSFEPFMAKTPEDVAKFTAAGGLPAWIRGCQAVIDLYAAAFPRTPILFVMHWPLPVKPGPEVEAALAQVVDYGLAKYPGHFGVMYHGLDANASDAEYFDRTIHRNAGRTTVGYQMVWSTTGINARWLRGSLEQCLEAGVGMKAHFIEVYGSDCDDPPFGPLLQRVGDQLKSSTGPAPAVHP